MIYINKKAITDIFRHNESFIFVYYGLNKVWEWIRSCFGKGYWINNKPWLNNDAWKNNI